MRHIGKTFLYEEASKRYEEVNKYYQSLEKRIGKYPPGKIHIVNSKKGVQYYLRENSKDKSGIYISKKNDDVIKCFLQKRYDMMISRILRQERDNLKKLLTKSEAIISKMQDVYSASPEEVKRYIEPVDVSDEDYVSEWTERPYRGKEIPSNIPIFVTNRGEHVRSKSELIIANSLEKHGIPYKYECPFTLSNGGVIHPDFTVLNVERRKEMYWEHRGMMDDREYSRNSVQRIKMLLKEGVILGDNLIITEETQTSPLGTDEVEKIINLWLLS